MNAPRLHPPPPRRAPRPRCSSSSAWRSSWSSSTSRSSTSRCRRSARAAASRPTGLQWVVNAYTLTFAGFLMLGGRCADLLGRRRVFLAGTALFALSSLACALAELARPAARRQGAAGLRRRGRLAGDALDHHELLRGRGRAQPRGRHVGRDGRARRVLGRAARRHPHADARLAGDLRHQRAPGLVVIALGAARDPDAGRAARGLATSTSPAPCSSPRA